jgi:hypothetical protein
MCDKCVQLTEALELAQEQLRLSEEKYEHLKAIYKGVTPPPDEPSPKAVHVCSTCMGSRTSQDYDDYACGWFDMPCPDC